MFLSFLCIDFNVRFVYGVKNTVEDDVTGAIEFGALASATSRFLFFKRGFLTRI